MVARKLEQDRHESALDVNDNRRHPRASNPGTMIPQLLPDHATDPDLPVRRDQMYDSTIMFQCLSMHFFARSDQRYRGD